MGVSEFFDNKLQNRGLLWLLFWQPATDTGNSLSGEPDTDASRARRPGQKGLEPTV